MSSKYAIYVVPDQPEVLGPCESISFGINWGGPHITISTFTIGNEKKIPPILDYIKKEVNPRLSKQGSLWNPLHDVIKLDPYMYRFESDTLNQFSDFLRKHVENVKEHEFHIYNRLGVNPDISLLGKTTWSLIMIKQTNQHVEWLTSTKVPLYCINT